MIKDFVSPPFEFIIENQSSKTCFAHWLIDEFFIHWMKHFPYVLLFGFKPGISLSAYIHFPLVWFPSYLHCSVEIINQWSITNIYCMSADISDFIALFFVTATCSLRRNDFCILQKKIVIDKIFVDVENNGSVRLYLII